MRILISGSHGEIGSALVAHLGAGHEVVRLVRHAEQARGDEILWHPEAGMVDLAGLEGFDAVVHLGGVSIAGRWTAERKRQILTSRVGSTRLLSESLARLRRPPAVFVCASAMGYYGDRGDEILTEESGSGGTFLAEVCRQWEAATGPASDAGIRVVNTRCGIVLSPDRGALAKMLPVFRVGGGGKLGSGRQWWSWVVRDDVARAIHHVIARDRLRGPVNVGTPEPVTNGQFTHALGHVLGRPTVARVPAGLVRLALGQMADELLLASCRMSPHRLLGSGFVFDHPRLEGAMRHLLTPRVQPIG